MTLHTRPRQTFKSLHLLRMCFSTSLSLSRWLFSGRTSWWMAIDSHDRRIGQSRLHL